MADAREQNASRATREDVPPGLHVNLNDVDVAELGDATRDIGVAFQKKLRSELPDRSSSWHAEGNTPTTVSDIAQPGGFRRHFVSQSAASAHSSALDTATETERRMAGSAEVPVVRSYIQTDFVDLLIAANDRFNVSFNIEPCSFTGSAARLVGDAAERPRGETSKARMTLLLIKMLIGSIVLFLPRTMMNGGLLLSGMTLIANGVISSVGIILLIECVDELVKRGDQQISYGNVATAAMGDAGRVIVNVSLCMGQLGFISSYYIFIKGNLRQASQILSNCAMKPHDALLIAILVAGFIPLTWVRRLRYFAFTNMLGNVCIATGLMLVLGIVGGSAMANGFPSDPVVYFKFDTYALAIGTCATAFEGIGCIVPIYESTGPALRPKFKQMFATVMAGILTFMVLFASTCYVALRSQTKTNILLNLPTGGLSAGVQLLYTLAVVCTYPLVFYPIVTIIERALLPASGADNNRVKWQKNFFRICVNIFCAAVAFFCADKLDNFLAIIGSVCCVPLAIIYPAVLHSKIVGGRPVTDTFMMVLGGATSLFVLFQALESWNDGAEPDPCICPPCGPLPPPPPL